MRAGATACAEHAFVLAPHPQRRDWFAVPTTWTAEIAAAPAVQFDRRFGFIVHRSHLPLLARTRIEARQLLTKINPPGGDSPIRDHERATFDATTEVNGWTLRAYQHTGREFIRSRRGTLLADGMRVGKAQPLNARVLTPTGWRQMGDLQVGDEIVDPDGGTAHIVGVFPQGIKPVYRITLCDGSTTRCCDEHLWAVATPHDRHRKDGFRVLPLRIIRKELRQLTPSRTWGQGNRRFFVPLTTPVTFTAAVHPLPVAPYLLGALLGDGNLTGNSISLCNGGDEILDLVAPLLPPRVRIIDNGRCTYRLTVEDGGFQVSNPLLDAVRNLGLHGRDSFTKFIPVTYLRAPAVDRLAILRGLMDTDGDVSKKGAVSFNTVSATLRDGVLELVRSLGGFASISLHKPKYDYKGEERAGALSYRLHIRLPVNPFLMRRKAESWKIGYLARGIESVKYVENTPCQCIAVDSKRNLYITDDYIVTHNTAQAIASHDLELGPMLVAAPLATREVWLTWFARRWPDIRPLVLRGRHIEHAPSKRPVRPQRDRGYDILEGDRFQPDLLANAKLIFCNYDILGAWKDLRGRRIGTLVLDEIHLLSQRNSRRAEAANFAAVIAERVIGATGTPIWNRPAGLFTTLSCLAPAAFGKFFDYATRYCNAHPGANGYIYDEASNEDEFRERMSEIMIRRTWSDVSSELPAIERAVEVVDITEAQQFEVEKEAERVRDHAKRTTAIGALARFRRLLAKLKTPAAIDVAHRILQSGEKVVVWTWHKDIALSIEDALGKRGFPGFVVTGATNMDIREDILNRWRTFPNPAPLTITMGAGQVGIDLTAAPQAVAAELDFTPAVVAQAEMRTFSPLRPMAITYIIIDHEIERRILDALQSKCDTAQRMGVPAAESTVGVLASAFARATGGSDDFDALAKAIMLEHPDIEDDDDYHGALWNYDWESGQ